MQSELEKQVLDKVDRLKRGLPSYDRGVIIGLFLSCIPLLPACLIGSLVSGLNLYLLKKNKIETKNAKFIHAGIYIGSFFTFFWITALYRYDPIGIYWELFSIYKQFLIEFIYNIFDMPRVIKSPKEEMNV